MSQHSEQLTAKATIQIQKPVATVFEGIVDPENMSQYFIARGSGRMEQGATLSWYFPEFPDECPVSVTAVSGMEKISFVWDPQSFVTITLAPQQDGSTIVTVEEVGGQAEKSIDWLRGQTEGWANFLACLKAYLEYGINLRKGAFSFLQQP